MQSIDVDLDMGDSSGSDASSKSERAVCTPPECHGYVDEPMTDFYANDSFTPQPVELTAPLSGDASARPNQNNNNDTPTPQMPTFDPRALLNPKAAASKRPASSGGDHDRGRTDPTIAGQVSLVERLHNVQERTASPAKRVKTDENRKKLANGSSFGGSSALGLQNQNINGHTHPQQAPAIDLTMSACPCKIDFVDANYVAADDEDDVQVLGDNMSEVICIGKLKYCYIQAHTVPFPDPKKYLGNSGQVYFRQYVVSDLH